MALFRPAVPRLVSCLCFLSSVFPFAAVDCLKPQVRCCHPLLRSCRCVAVVCRTRLRALSTFTICTRLVSSLPASLCISVTPNHSLSECLCSTRALLWLKMSFLSWTAYIQTVVYLLSTCYLGWSSSEINWFLFLWETYSSVRAAGSGSGWWAQSAWHPCFLALQRLLLLRPLAPRFCFHFTLSLIPAWSIS